jgi:hypothetical protein
MATLASYSTTSLFILFIVLHCAVGMGSPTADTVNYFDAVVSTDRDDDSVTAFVHTIAWLIEAPVSSLFVMNVWNARTALCFSSALILRSLGI